MIIYTQDNFKHGTDYFFHCISVVINCMLCHGYAPTSFLHAAVIPIPKNAKLNLSSTCNYRAIALSSIFSKILDKIIMKDSGLGCHVGRTFAGAFAHADDLALVSPSLSGQRQMIQICEQYAMEYSIVFNPVKSKLMCFNSVSSDKPYLTLCGKPVDVVDHDLHLGNCIYNNIYIQCSNSMISDFYRRSYQVSWVDSCFPTSCMVNEVHAFFNGMGAGILLTCLVVLTLCTGLTLLSASSFFGQWRLVAACPCPQYTH